MSASEEAVLRSRVAVLEQLLEVLETEAQNRGEALEAERKKLLKVLAHLPAAVAIYSGPDHILEFANSSFQQLVGPRDFLGRPVREAFPEVVEQGYGGEKYKELLDQVYESGEPFFATEAPIELLESPGRPRKLFVNFALIPILDGSRNTAGLVSHSVDVTEQVLSREQAEMLATDLGQLAEASVAINAAFSVEAALNEAADRARRIIGAHRAVARMLSDDHARGIIVGQSLSDEFANWYDDDGLQEVLAPAAWVTESKRPLRLSADELRAFPGAEPLWNPSPGLPAIWNWLGVPLLDREGRVLGSLAVSSKDDGDFTRSDEDILLQLAQVAATAAANAVLYENAQSTAETLQLSLLPRELPQSADLQIEARYMASTEGTHVGGDWYDAFSLADGKIAVVLGDVAGKGIQAAALMGQLRVAVRAYAFEGHSPLGVVQRLDRLAQEMSQDTMVTLVYLVLDPPAGQLTYVSAGHPPPILVHGEQAEMLEAHSLPLGVTGFTEFSEERTAFPPGSVLIMFSDGLIERRGESLQVGLDRLQEAALVQHQDLAAYCDQLIERMRVSPWTDDVALLVVRSLAAPKDLLEIRIASRPEEASTARRALARWLEQKEMPPEESFDLVMACGEAIANAIEHAYFSNDGVVFVRSRFSDGEVTVSVQDYGRWKGAASPFRGRGLKLMRSLADGMNIERSANGTKVEIVKFVAGKLPV